jgi:hypothetical protein
LADDHNSITLSTVDTGIGERNGFAVGHCRAHMTVRNT